MKKSILLVMTSLNTGGIATAIRNMISYLNRSEFDIDLLLFENDSNNLIANCTILSAGKFMRLTSISQNKAFEESKVLGLYRFSLGGLSRLFSHEIAYKMLLNHTKSIDKHYDVAISCTQSGPIHSLYGGCNEFVLSKVKADLKITYIHCDYKLYGLNSSYSHKIYEKFDRIAAVSRSVKDCFLSCEPTFSDKTYISSNFHDYSGIRIKSNENSYEYDSDYFNFITVARLGREKGHLRMLPIIRNLIDQGLEFRWHIVGGDIYDAPSEFLSLMKELQVEKCIVFHGNQSNPYRFMKNADLLLIPSFHEAAPMVYEEARCLNLPILTTRTLSADELVTSKKIGIVCNNDNNAIETALKQIISHPDILDDYRHPDAECDNIIALKEFKNLIY